MVRSEIKELSTPVIVGLLTFLTILSFAANQGENALSDIVDGYERFDDSVVSKRQFATIQHKGIQGEEIFFIPGKLYPIFYSSGNSPFLAHVNSEGKWKIFNNLKNDGFKSTLDFGNIFLAYFVFSMWYGWNGNYRFKSISRSQIVLFREMGVKLFILCIGAMGNILLPMLLAGISINESIFPYMLLATLLTSLSYILGLCISLSKKSYLVGLIAILLILPMIVRDQKTDTVELQAKNQKVLMDVENAIKERYTIDKDLKSYIPEFLTKLVENIGSNESVVLNDLKARYIRKDMLSSLFPATFYTCVCMEMSGCGRLNFIDFYRHVMEQGAIFMEVHAENRFNKNLEQRILKAPQYLGQSKKPNYFWLGILMTLFYTSVGLFFIYRKTKETNRVPLVKAQGLIRVKGNRSSFLRKVNLTKYHILRPPIPEMPVMTYMNFCGVMVYEIRGKYLDKKFKNLEPTEALWVQFKIADAMKKDTFVFGQYVIDSQDDWTKSIDAIIKKWRKDGKTLVQITESDLAWPGDPDHHYVWKKDKDSGEFKFVKIPLS